MEQLNAKDPSMNAETPTQPSEENQAADLGAPADATPSAGALLKAYREEAGLEQETLATALKISAQKLQALESDDYSALPAVYFARGLAANICRHLKKDPAPVLAKMPGEKPHVPAAEKTDTPRVQSIAPIHIDAAPGRGIIKWLIAAAVLLALVAGAVLALPQLRARLAGTPASASSAPDAASTLPPPQTDAAPAAASPVLAPASATSAAAAPMTLQPAAAAIGTASATLPGDAQNTLQIRASGDTWVKVTTTKGKRLFEANLKAGDERAIAIQQYPVRVTVGKAENVQVIDRGQPFDLTSIAAQGTARFELKP